LPLTGRSLEQWLRSHEEAFYVDAPTISLKLAYPRACGKGKVRGARLPCARNHKPETGSGKMETRKWELAALFCNLQFPVSSFQFPGSCFTIPHKSLTRRGVFPGSWILRVWRPCLHFVEKILC